MLTFLVKLEYKIENSWFNTYSPECAGFWAKFDGFLTFSHYINTLRSEENWKCDVNNLDVLEASWVR